MENKGISPLIATVLIIGFAVALGAIILVWGGGFTKKMTEKSELTAEQKIACTDVSIDVGTCRVEVCNDDSNNPTNSLTEGPDCTTDPPPPNKIANDLVKFTVQNNGKYDIKKVKARVIFSEPDGAEQTFDASVPSDITVGGIGMIEHPLFTVDRISGIREFLLTPLLIWRVEVLPIIGLNNEEVTCEGARAVLEFGKWGTTTEDYYTITPGMPPTFVSQSDDIPEKYYVFKTC